MLLLHLLLRLLLHGVFLLSLFQCVFLLFLFLFHAALNVLQSPQAQPGGGAEEQRAKRKLLFLHVDILMCRFRVKQRLR